MEQKKILIADDEIFQLVLIEQSLDELQDRGVELIMAKNGEEALAAIAAENPDLLILDVMMPKIDGFEVSKRVKEDPETRDIYILMLTARGMEVDKFTAHDIGVDRFMTKPFDPDEVLAVARQVLGYDHEDKEIG